MGKVTKFVQGFVAPFSDIVNLELLLLTLPLRGQNGSALNLNCQTSPSLSLVNKV